MLEEVNTRSSKSNEKFIGMGMVCCSDVNPAWKTVESLFIWQRVVGRKGGVIF